MFLLNEVVETPFGIGWVVEIHPDWLKVKLDTLAQRSFVGVYKEHVTKL